MAISLRRFYYKYTKCLVIVVLLAFFIQILIAVSFFPSDSDNLLKGNLYTKPARHDVVGVSARKNNFAFIDDEDFSAKQRKSATHLRLEEIDFVPPCEINSREAISAIHRAKTQNCKQQIVNKTCLIQSGNFYPEKLPNYCVHTSMTYNKHLGCYLDEKKMRLLSGFYGNYANTNSPNACLDICIQAGFPFAGVQYASECFCGDTRPPSASLVADETCDMKCPGDESKNCGGYFTMNIYETGLSKCFCGDTRPPSASLVADETCDMKCPGDESKNCGGYFTMNIYETGLSKFTPRIPKSLSSKRDTIQIVFLLTLNGRALRQVHRLINALYRSNHYFYIHIDKRQDYLHRKLSILEKEFPNIKLAARRYSTIWGGASLLKMLLAAMKDFSGLGWNWDFVINLSESDFPIKSLEELENFLSANKGLNFVKSHGREVQRFIKKQGLDKTFIECDTHMWRVGERKLPRGLVVDGGSDWIALSPDFVSYVVGKHDELLAGLDIIFQHTLLPAESFFHTALRNSQFCNTYVDNNLHVTNWKRKLGCKCQYKHVVDWCGCSPNDFRTEDWPRIQNTQDRQLFFARKFEPIINQEIINRVEQYIGFKDHYLMQNLEAYWQSIYNIEDLTASSDDLMLTHAGSIVRHNARILLEEGCRIEPDIIIEITSYHHADIYKGNLILHKAIVQDGVELTMETWYKPKKYIELNFENQYVDFIKTFKVSSEYDQKEMMFRNLANFLGPLSEPVLLYQFTTQIDRNNENLTLIWLDPTGAVGDVNSIHVDESNLTNFIKPNLKAPLLPGIWKVGLFEKDSLMVSTKFLVSPLEYFSGKELSSLETSIIHSGSQNSYKNYSYLKPKEFLPDQDESILLQKISQSNIQRLHQDLREWIDGLNSDFYNVLGSCVKSNAEGKNKITCGNHKFEYCESTQWSSLSPDPKGSIGKLIKSSGRLERV